MYVASLHLLTVSAICVCVLDFLSSLDKDRKRSEPPKSPSVKKGSSSISL